MPAPSPSPSFVVQVAEILDRNAARLAEVNARLACLVESIGAVAHGDMPQTQTQEFTPRLRQRRLRHGEKLQAANVPPVVMEADDAADFDPDQRAALIAQILYGLFGDKALDLFKAASDEDADEGPADVPEGYRRIHYLSLLEAWNELDHPRGPHGRFIPKGSPEAVAAAKATVKRVLSSPVGKSPDSAEQVAEHLSILTVKQLKALAKEHGFIDKSIPKMLRDELVAAIKARLSGTPEEEKKEAEKEAGEEPKGESGPVEPPQAAPKVEEPAAPAAASPLDLAVGIGRQDAPAPAPAPKPAAATPAKPSLTRELATDVLSTIDAMTDRKAGLGPMLPDVYDAIKDRHPEMTEAQFHELLKAMQQADLGTLQTWGGSGLDELARVSGHSEDRFPDGNRSGKAAWFAPRTDAAKQAGSLPSGAGSGEKPAAPAEPGAGKAAAPVQPVDMGGLANVWDTIAKVSEPEAQAAYSRVRELRDKPALVELAKQMEYFGKGNKRPEKLPVAELATELADRLRARRGASLRVKLIDRKDQVDFADVPARTAEAHQTVARLYQSALDPQLSADDIVRQVNAFANLPAEAVAAVARKFGISRRLPSKQEYLQAIARKIVDRKGAFERAKI